MKQATGEANMTVITIVIIALVTLIGTPIVMSALNSSGKSACCAANGGVYKNGTCKSADGTKNVSTECNK